MLRVYTLCLLSTSTNYIYQASNLLFLFISLENLIFYYSHDTCFCFFRYGGIYLDSDVIVLKSISSLNNSVGMENHVAGSGLNGAVMAFRRKRYY